MGRATFLRVGFAVVPAIIAACTSYAESEMPEPSSDSGSDDVIDASNDASAVDASDAAPDAPLTYADIVMSDEPVAYYRLGETTGTAQALGPAGQPGTYGASVARGAAGLIAGDPNLAASLPGYGLDGGTANIVQVPKQPKLEPTAQVSLECWVKLLYGDATIVTYGGGASTNAAYAIFTPPDGHPAFFIGTFGFIGEADIEIASSTTNHLVGTYDGSFVRLYVNGVMHFEQAKVGVVGPYNGNGLGIGGLFDGTATQATGIIDEVAVYDHALTPERVAAHYAAGTTAK